MVDVTIDGLKIKALKESPYIEIKLSQELTIYYFKVKDLKPNRELAFPLNILKYTPLDKISEGISPEIVNSKYFGDFYTKYQVIENEKVFDECLSKTECMSIYVLNGTLQLKIDDICQIEAMSGEMIVIEKTIQSKRQTTTHTKIRFVLSKQDPEQDPKAFAFYLPKKYIIKLKTKKKNV